ESVGSGLVDRYRHGTGGRVGFVATVYGDGFEFHAWSPPVFVMRECGEYRRGVQRARSTAGNRPRKALPTYSAAADCSVAESITASQARPVSSSSRRSTPSSAPQVSGGVSSTPSPRSTNTVLRAPSATSPRSLRKIRSNSPADSASREAASYSARAVLL